MVTVTGKPVNLTQAEIEIYAAIGYAQTRWAELEYTLCRIFRETVSPLAHSPSGSMSPISPAEDAFWAIISFDGKMKMTVDAVERHLSLQSRYSSADLLQEWAKASKRANEKAANRNKLAHGSLYSVAENGEIHISYVPYYHKAMTGLRVVLGTPEHGEIEISTPTELDGWDAKRIHSVAKGFDVSIIRLKHFHAALLKHNTEVTASEVATRQFFESAHQQYQSGSNNQMPPQPFEALPQK